MKWSLKIGRYSGIDVRMHVTFLLLVGWIALLYWRQGQSASDAVVGVAFILFIFLCVILHEFGHALAARRYDIKTRDIILLPIGGVARLEKMPTNPLHEFWISIAGPAVNVVLAADGYPESPHGSVGPSTCEAAGSTTCCSSWTAVVSW